MGRFRKSFCLLTLFLAVIASPSSGQSTSALISANTSWRYNQSGTDLSGQFQQIGYDDSAWPEGQGLLGWETGNPQAYPYPILTPLTVANGRVTYYFRTHFNLPTNPAGIFLLITNYVDDGLVFYINGAEAGRVRIPGGPVTASTLAETANPEGQALVLVVPGTNLVQGDNLMAVEVHQSTSNNGDVVFGMTLSATRTPPLPDLVIYGPAVNARIETYSFGPLDCEVNEGCGIAGTRRLLRFDTETRNIGGADLVLGSPINNPLFVYHSCHAHYHFLGFADYRLLDSNGVQIAVGNKVGFCLEDLTRFDSTAASNAAYTCSYQGIQRGWGDIYSSSLPCQYVDITGVPPGTYTLELEIDPDHKLAESNESNNITRTTVVLKTPCTGPPLNDSFANAQTLSNRTTTVFGDSGCATRESGEPFNPVNSGGRSVWYRWTAPYSGTVTINTIGSNFDTILALYRGTSLGALSLLGSNDDISTANRASQVTASVSSGTIYQISVDGYSTDADPRVGGDVILTINPGGNDLLANAVPLSGVAGTINGSTIGTGKEALEPNHAGFPGGHSVWYSWQAPFSGLFVFDTVGSRFDTLLAFYTGPNMAALQTVVSNDDSASGISSKVTLNATGGSTYRIAIDGKENATGIFTLNWRMTPRLTAPQQISGNFLFNLSSNPGQACWIDTSSNALDWSPWLRVTNSTGNMVITDPLSAESIRRFYKARAE